MDPNSLDAHRDNNDIGLVLTNQTNTGSKHELLSCLRFKHRRTHYQVLFFTLLCISK